MANWFTGDIVVNGIKIHYHRTGGDKPTLVIAHGVTDNGISWSRVARALEQDYDVIMYDRRGHGFSDAPQSGYTFEDHAEDLVNFIVALNLDRPCVMGHSGAQQRQLFSLRTILIGLPAWFSKIRPGETVGVTGMRWQRGWHIGSLGWGPRRDKT